ncbi:hypothetical protein QTP70_017080 [Hemibagrus guttatus]|uniref:Synaptotagmin-like protein 1 n=1 Tax=Hemibagrus guttatus TaxID=175788 RepID=A0AAE0QZM9_9TELE|nr:hypothetical protein QTP70_017080 [Hemibagrus guttatus]KAK3563515.1 hypothetical protein QTP86_030381 [Hemibagrus guttatus]
MKTSRDATIFIDLSFLSPEEEAVIQKVLLRDEDLKKNEIGRVRKLRESVPDPKWLKVLSGEWFEDLKSKRYGRQPHVSAVVRSSMRWKKSAAHKPNPFLKAVPEDIDEQKNKTHPVVSADPRSIHPALSVQVQQETRDEAIILEEFPGSNPVLKVIEAGCQSESKLQDQTALVEPLKLESVQESEMKPAIANEINTNISDTGRTMLEEDLRLEPSLETRARQTDGNVSRNFKIRSFSKAQETSDWEVPQLDSDYDVSKEPQSKVEVVVINSNKSTETKVTEKQNNLRSELLINSRSGFKEEIQSPIPKRRSANKIRVMNNTTRETTPGRMEELNVDLNRKDDPGILENPKIGPDNNINTLEFVNLEQSLDRVHKDKKQPAQEIIITDFRQRSPTRMEELFVDLDVKKDPDFLEGPVNNVNASKYAILDQSLDPVQKEKERSGEEIVVVGFKERSPTKVEDLIVDVDVKKDPDFLEDPVNDVNPSKYANLDQSLDPVQKEKERSGEEIMVIGFKQRYPTKVEDLIVDVNVKKDPDFLEDSVTNVNAPKYANLDQSLDRVQKGKERVVEDIIVTNFEQRSPKKVEELKINLNVEKNPDFLEGPTNNVNTTKCVNWDQKSSDPIQKEKERLVEEIIVADFKHRSPRRMEELNVDLNVEANPDFVENINTGPVHKDFHKDENTLAVADRDKLQESVAGGRSVFDVELKSANTNQKDSKEIEEIGGTEQEGRFLDREDECVISENDILASVYARAIRPKSGVSKTTLVQEPVQKTADVIPTIVIVPSESEEMNEMNRGKNEKPGPEVLVEFVKPATDTWEDEGVDSDEDSSSASSHDSDLSGKRGQFSASTLSVTERTASLLSVYSDAGDFGNVAVQGSVEFAIMYSPLGELVIMVEQCQDLAIANLRKQRTDPYVKTYLYPDKRSKRKTSIKKRTVNPVYVESLRYKVKREELHGKTLNLSVWHNDSRGRNAFLGQVEISLKNWDWKHEALTWYNLQPKNVDNQESQEYQGVLCVSLKYVPSDATGGSKLATGEIHIWLREARHLRRLKAHGADSFVKCYMLPDTSKKSRQKTRVVKKTQNPVYNHTMVYDGFRVGEMCEACCELTVWDNNKLSNQFLGGVRLSLGTGQSYGKKVDWMDSENEEVEIWKQMMANPNSWVEAELPLRSSMTPRK